MPIYINIHVSAISISAVHVYYLCMFLEAHFISTKSLFISIFATIKKQAHGTLCVKISIWIYILRN